MKLHTYTYGWLRCCYCKLIFIHSLMISHELTPSFIYSFPQYVGLVFSKPNHKSAKKDIAWCSLTKLKTKCKNSDTFGKNKKKHQLNIWHKMVNVIMLSTFHCCDTCFTLTDRLRDRTDLNCVPDHILLNIFSYLNVRSLCQSSQVKLFSILIN